MNFTHGKKRKNISWKPNKVGIIVPKQSKPINNNVSDNTVVSDFTSKFGTARPLKQYRKQLVPYFGTKSSKNVSIDDINNSSRTYIKNTSDSNIGFFDNCNTKEHVNVIYDYVLDKPNVCLGTKTDGVCKGGNTNVNYRTGNSNLDKKYYQTSQAYLKSKCKTYEQNLKQGKLINNDDNSYEITSCNESKCNKTYYKPNNKKFAKQGSVESSTRLLRLKNDTINKNGASFNSAYGRQAANAGSYRNSINGSTIYFEKDKHNLNSCSSLPLNFRQKNKNSNNNCN